MTPLPGPWHRIHAIDASGRRPTVEGEFVSVLPAALRARQHGRPFVSAWLSRGGGTPLELVTNASADSRVLFPPGARSKPIGDGWLAALDPLTWISCPARQAPPLVDHENQEPDQLAVPTLFESTLTTLMNRRFVWLVIARPVDDLDKEIAELRTSLDAARAFEAERSRFEVERAERRMVELDTFREGGLWEVRVLVGSGSAEEVREIAPVLAGSVDIGHHPYRLRSGGTASTVDRLAEVLRSEVKDESGDAVAPFTATAGVLASLAGLPRHEVPGLRVLDRGYFDVTSETSGARTRGSIELGQILDNQDHPVGGFSVPLSTINRHVFVTGATGAGKSQTVRHLLEQLSHHGIPWLAIEPAKSEYSRMSGRLQGVADVTLINPSDPDSVPMSLNPLKPEPGYPVQAHIDMVRTLFQAAFDADEPFPQVMSQALQRVYEQCGWDVITGTGVPGRAVSPTVPRLEALQRSALQIVAEVGYGKELMADVKGFVDVRLRSLRVGSAGRFFEGGHPADVAGLLRRNVVLAIEDVANDEDKAFLMGTLIIRIVEHLRLRARRERTPGLRHVIVIEEAHRLLRNRGEERASSHAVELFAGMLAETRAYGEGIVVAEQIPTKLVPDVVKNTALKVAHRLPAHDDRHLVGSAMNVDDEQSRQVVALSPGVAAVFADGMDRPVRLRVPLGESRERELASPPPPIDGRRSAACGPRCVDRLPCSLLQLREADLIATDPELAWLRIWADTLVLAYLTNRSLPAVPGSLGLRGGELPERLRDCALATVLDGCVERRAGALRERFDPVELIAEIAPPARSMLAGSGRWKRVAPPGPDWVVPQVQWLHELERVFGYGQPIPRAGDQAPPPDFPLMGTVEPTEPLLTHRVWALRRHPMSMELERNRKTAWQAILGDDAHQAFNRDVAFVAMADERNERLATVARVLKVDWLEAVLSWPSRFIQPLAEGGSLPTLEG